MQFTPSKQPDSLPTPEAGQHQASADATVTHGATRRGTITLAGTFVGGALMFCNEILAARFLGLAIYGYYALAIVFARIGEEVSMFGFGVSVLHFVPVYLRNGDRPRLFGAILLGLAFPLGIGLALMLVMWTAAPLIAEYVLHEPAAVPYLRFFAFSIPLIGLAEVMGRITRGFGYAAYHVAVRDVIPRVSYFVFLAVLILGNGPRLWIAMAFVASYFLTSLCGLFSVVYLTGRDLWRITPTIPLREMYAYSIASYVTVLLFLVAGAADYIMISMMRTSEEAGLYRAASIYSSVLIVINNSFAASMVHLYPVLVRESRLQELNLVYHQATRLVSVLATPAFVVIALNGTDLLALMGAQFTAAAPTLLLLLFANLVRSCIGIAPLLLLVSGRQRVETFNALFYIGFTIVMNLILIPRYGIVGAALTTVAMSLGLSALRIWQVKKYFALTTFTPEFIKTVSVCLGLGLLILLASKLTNMDEPGFKNLAIRLPLSAAAMAIGMWRLGISDNQKDVEVKEPHGT